VSFEVVIDDQNPFVGTSSQSPEHEGDGLPPEKAPRDSTRIRWLTPVSSTLAPARIATRSVAGKSWRGRNETIAPGDLIGLGPAGFQGRLLEENKKCFVAIEAIKMKRQPLRPG
jgi:hypothetical protein